MRKKKYCSQMVSSGVLWLFIFLLILGTAVAYPGDWEQVYFIRARKIFTVKNGVIENGTIVIRNGLIEAVGINITPPVEAEVVKADSFFVYPGFIDGHTAVAQKKSKEKPESNQAGRTRVSAKEAMKASGIYPEYEVFDQIDPNDSQIAKYRQAGITTVLSVPEKGIFAGQSALLNLAGEKAGQMVLKSPVALHITYERQRGRYPSTLMGVIALQRQTFYDAIHYQNLWMRYQKQRRGIPRPEVNPSLQVLGSVLSGKLPVIIQANTENEIKRALKLASEFKLRFFLSGVVEGWRVIDWLKRTSPPILLSVNYPKPENVTGYAYLLKVEKLTEEKPEKKKEETPEEKAIYQNAAKLHQAGLRFAFTSMGLKNPADYLKNVRKAVQHGLPEQVALEAMTLVPAQFFGIQDVAGSIEEGKMANLVLTDKPLFEEKATIKMVFIDGKKFEVKAPEKKKGGAAAVDVTGTWEATVKSPMGETDITLVFKQSGNELTGEFRSEFGTSEIEDGSVSGNEIEFTVTLEMGPQAIEMVFVGKVEGNTIEGTIDLGEMGTASWSATKPGL